MKFFKLIAFIIAAVMLVSVFASCNEDNTNKLTETTVAEATTGSEENKTDENGNVITNPIVEVVTDENGEIVTDENGEATTQPVVDKNAFNYEIMFVGDQFKYSDADAQQADGKNLILTKPGSYKISGTLNDGTIVVNVAKTERVTLLLDGFTGSCSTSAVIHVKSADKVYIDLVKGSNNTVTDASSYVYPDPAMTKPNACIYSADDLTIKGGGTLTVNANYNNGIGCKNDIDIKNGHIIVNAVKNAIKGNDSVSVMGDAEVIINRCEDGIKSDSLDEGKGFVLITEEAKVSINCNDDAIQASQSVTTTAGVLVTVKAGGDIVNCDGTQTIAENTIITE